MLVIFNVLVLLDFVYCAQMAALIPLSLGQKEPKKVLVKSTQQISFVKEDCILEDSTGHTSIHIWRPLITKLKNNYSYRLNNLTVKNVQGNTFLSTSPFTTYSQQEKTLSSLKGPAILETPDKEIFVGSFKLQCSQQIIHISVLPSLQKTHH